MQKNYVIHTKSWEDIIKTGVNNSSLGRKVKWELNLRRVKFFAGLCFYLFNDVLSTPHSATFVL
jgi:hypothetical protein